MKLRSVFIPAIASCVFIVCPTRYYGQTQTDTTQPAQPPGAAAGQVIGTLVKTAITTAFPAVGTILTSILAKTPNNTGSKVSVANLQKGAQAANTSVKSSFTAAAQQAIAPVGQVSAELATVNLFLVPSVEANKDVIKMRMDVSDATIDWADVKVNWTVAKAQLNKISSVSSIDINNVNDLFLRNELTQIKATNTDLVLRIDAAVASQDKGKVTSLTSNLSDILNGMPAVAGYELANLQADIASLAAWAKGAGGTPAPPQSLEIFKNQLVAMPLTK